jgi:hypothetical protein
VTRSSTFWRAFGIGAAILTVLLSTAIWQALHREVDPPKPTEGTAALAPTVEKVVKLMAIEFFETYSQNPQAADARWKGKRVALTGRGWTKPSIDGRYDFGFECVIVPPLLREWSRVARFLPNVVCYLNQEGEREAVRLDAVSQVVVVGTVKGAAQAPVWKNLCVILENCDLQVMTAKAPKDRPPQSPKK